MLSKTIKTGAVVLKMPAKPLEMYLIPHDKRALPPVIIKTPAIEACLISDQEGFWRDCVKYKSKKIMPAEPNRNAEKKNGGK